MSVDAMRANSFAAMNTPQTAEAAARANEFTAANEPLLAQADLETGRNMARMDAANERLDILNNHSRANTGNIIPAVNLANVVNHDYVSNHPGLQAAVEGRVELNTNTRVGDLIDAAKRGLQSQNPGTVAFSQELIGELFDHMNRERVEHGYKTLQDPASASSTPSGGDR